MFRMCTLITSIKYIILFTSKRITLVQPPSYLRTTNFVALACHERVRNLFCKAILGKTSVTMMNFLFPLSIAKDEDSLAAELITQSMMNTTSYVEICRGTPETRKEAMEFLFRRNLYMVKQKCPESIHMCYDSDHVMECFFMLVPSFGAQSTLYEKIFVGGILEFALRYGFDTTLRLIRLADFGDAIVTDLMKGRRYFQLQRMVVLKSKQGQGIGSKHLGNALKEADQLQLPVVLSTEEDRNVVFYSRLGFKVVLETEYKVPEGDDSKYNHKYFFMIREPVPLA